MYVKLVLKETINNKQMYSPRLQYKYRDSSVLQYTPTVHPIGSLSRTHTLLVQTHPHDVSAPLIPP